MEASAETIRSAGRPAPGPVTSSDPTQWKSGGYGKAVKSTAGAWYTGSPSATRAECSYMAPSCHSSGKGCRSQVSAAAARTAAHATASPATSRREVAGPLAASDMGYSKVAVAV